MTPLLLGILAVVLAGPVPSLLGRVGALTSVPRAAVVLWQAVALAAVLAAVGSGLALALSLVTTAGHAGGLDLGPLRIGAHLLVLTLTITVLARLTWALITNAHRLRALRRRHRDLVDLAGSAAPNTSTLTPAGVGVRVLHHDVPTAYCVPAVRDSRVVVSDAAIARLYPIELDAVLAHENAHLRARHDLVIEVFTALWIAFPHGVRSRVALDQVRTLLEMHADDDAVRLVGAVPMARALVALTVGSSRAPAQTLFVSSGAEDLAGSATPQVLRRVERLAEADPRRASRPVLAASTYVCAAGILVVPTVTVALPWLQLAWRIVS